MKIDCHNSTLRITGLRELSAANSHALRDHACAALVPGLTLIEVDLSETSFVDGTGLGALVSLYETAMERNGSAPPVFRLLDPQPPVQQVFELTRMHHLFEIVLQTGHKPVNNQPQATGVSPSPSL